MDEDVQRFLRKSAEYRGVSEFALLRQILHVGGPIETEQFKNLFRGAGPQFISLLVRLDGELRLRNPGLHYVYRAKYLGFRREAVRGFGVASVRSQVFVSILSKTQILTIVLPLDPQRYTSRLRVRNLDGMGHHGVGSLAVEIPDNAAVDLFLDTFEDWLNPPHPPGMLTT